MNFFKTFIAILIAIALQTSFFQNSAVLPFFPNLPLVVLFLAAFWLTYPEMMIMAAAAGLLVDLFSGLSFGVSSLSLIIVFTLFFSLKEKIYRDKIKGGMILLVFFLFFFFYPLVISFDHILKKLPLENFFLRFIQKQTIGEIFLSIFISLVLYYFIFVYYKNSRAARRH